MNDKEYIQEAIDILEPIPADEWLTEHFTDEIKRCCGLGHYNRILNSPSDYSEFSCGNHTEKTRYFLNIVQDKIGSFVAVNDGFDGRFLQETPKERVLECLKIVLTKLE